MLSEKVFLEGLIYFKDYYTTFNFDINSKTKVNVWYDALKHFDDKTFTGIVKAYCKSNVYAPQSPTHIIQHAEQLIAESKPTPDEAWEIGYGKIKACDFNFSRAYKELTDYPEIIKSIRQMESMFYNLKTAEVPFRRREFVELYSSELKKTARRQSQNDISALRAIEIKGELM